MPPVSTGSRRALLVFPLAALFNSFAMTGLLLVFGIAGRPETATDIALVQGATLALFYAFSANARNLILADGAAAGQLLRARLVLMLPLAAGAWFLGTGIGSASAALAAVLIVRRIAEWIGEIGLACHERRQRNAAAKRSLAVEGVTLAVCIVLPLGFDAALAASAIPWALAPLLAIRGADVAGPGGALPLRALLPHFGSTAIIGTSTYVFRLSIALIAGRTLAGELFTAFAIGGIVPTLFGQALAPTLAHRFGAGAWPRRLLAVPATLLTAGGAIAALALAAPETLAASGRSPLFWLAVGLSLAGGALMAVAAALRTQLIHRDDGREVFGPDLLANVLIASCVPFVYYLFGSQSLAGLYLLSGGLSLAFLWGAGHGRGVPASRRDTALLAIGALLVLPVFVQIGGGVFRDPSPTFDTGGALARLPVPLSVAALFAGIALLGNYAAATRTLTTIFFSALLFVTTALAASHGDARNEGARLILLAQFLLPMFGLVLGEMYGAATRQPLFERAALWVLLAVLPAQLAATWLQGLTVPQPQVFAFSIYQHREYFPTVVAALATMAGIGLWPFAGLTRAAVVLLLPVVAVHLAASAAAGALAGATAGAAGMMLRHARTGAWQVAAVLAIAVCAGAIYAAVTHAGSPAVRTATVATDAATGGEDRIATWRFYAAGVIASPRELLLGHAQPPDRSLYPSGRNYWLDALYNFGALALLPLAALLAATARLLWQRRAALRVDAALLGTAIAAAYLLLGENLASVGMRQPYPGILTFFIWGLLIARLRAASAPPAGATS